MKKALYVSVGKPIQAQKFELYKAPCGWARVDILRQQLKEDKIFKAKFSKKELKLIRGLK